MDTAKLLIIIITIIVIISYILRFFLKDKFPYDKCESVVTDTEKIFLFILLSIIKEDYYVLAKVRLADVVKVRPGTKEYIKHFSKIQSKHLDFVVVDINSFEPLLAIELDDPSHLRDTAKERDAIKDEILHAANIPILRIKTERKYNINKIRDEIFDLISD